MNGSSAGRRLFCHLSAEQGRVAVAVVFLFFLRLFFSRRENKRVCHFRRTTGGGGFRMVCAVRLLHSLRPFRCVLGGSCWHFWSPLEGRRRGKRINSTFLAVTKREPGWRRKRHPSLVSSSQLARGAGRGVVYGGRKGYATGCRTRLRLLRRFQVCCTDQRSPSGLVRISGLD